MGTAAVFRHICTTCRETQEWTSQPQLSRLSLGNLMLAAGLFFSGCNAMKGLNMLRNIGVTMLSYNTYMRYQCLYVIPAVTRVWSGHHTATIETACVGDADLRFAGDSQCDSAGHNAKYGTYSLMDVSRQKIHDLVLVQRNEVTSSQAMEREGLVRCMRRLDTDGLRAGMLDTDRHPSVKYMREHRPTMEHYFDVWHLAKGVKKKILAKAASRVYLRPLTRWAQSISNHMYWYAMTSAASAQLIEAKWLSLFNHVANIHEGHGELYARCLHGALEEEEDEDKDPREWLPHGSKCHKELSNITNSPYLLPDIGKMSPYEQTAGLESFHKVIGFFAPKDMHFFYNAMNARCQLAALHFNENSGRQQMLTDAGERRWAVSYPKHKDGDGVLKEVKTPCTYRYVSELIDQVLELRRQYPSYSRAEVLVNRAPPNLTDDIDLVPKREVIRRHQTRYILPY